MSCLYTLIHAPLITSLPRIEDHPERGTSSLLTVAIPSHLTNQQLASGEDTSTG
jgi:hypothetical protein